ncbi:hypothetical protein M422DRAFT_249230, partial [Sphaerobolus stellatus SS14]
NHTLQDTARLRVAARVPSSFANTLSASETQNVVLDYDLIRFGNIRSFKDLKSLPVIRTPVLGYDSASSFFLDFTTLRDFVDVSDNLAYALVILRMLPFSAKTLFARGSSYSTSSTELGIPELLSNLFLQTDDLSRVLSLREDLGNLFSSTRGVPSSFISSQPLDLLVNPKLVLSYGDTTQNLRSGIRLLSEAIEMLVLLCFPEKSTLSRREEIKDGQFAPQKSGRDEPTFESVSSLHNAVIRLAHDTLRNVELEHSESFLDD